jgi:hypothetical protein
MALPTTLQSTRRLLSVPVIYAMVLPLLLLDATMSLYQAVCFRLYGIERVRRRDYFAFDRHRLRYLDRVARLNCSYCSYANGVLAFAREVAARTEQFWCPIQHARAPAGLHPRHAHFLPYGDSRAFAARTRALREALASTHPAPAPFRSLP